MTFLYYTVIFCCFYVVACKRNPPSCTTPNGEDAICVSLFSCPILQEAITSKDPVVKEFVEASGCGDGQFMVCCGSLGNFTGNSNKSEPENKIKGNETGIKEFHRNFVIEKLLPTRTYCGMQHTDDYVYNETETSVDEFPWMVYIPSSSYHISYNDDIQCAGFLISRQYALTYTSCATKAFDSIIMGVYHRFRNISCLKTSFGEYDCTEPSRKVKIARWYDFNGFLLMRLEKKIFYSDFVRPICLPLDETTRAQIGDSVVASGWGDKGHGKPETVKKRIQLRVAENEKCESTELYYTMCALTQQNSTSYVCDGDGGGPLMYKRKNNWIAEGMISFTFNCNKNQQVYGQRITPEVLDWIIEKMEP